MAANFDIALNESTLSRINALIVDDLKSQLISAKQAVSAQVRDFYCTCYSRRWASDFA
jgi:hypothetical protein